jgi:glycosyltransferase involved in cell wall biosynthesis
MPAGIDTEIFSSKGGKRERRSVYYQGRIAPSKNVATLIEALSYCPEARLTLVGPEDPAYMARLRRDFTRLVSSGRVIFAGPKRNDETPALYGAHGLSVNLSAPGHYDKSVLESMACETPVIVSSPAFSGMVPERWRVSEKDARALGEKMTEMMNLPEAQYEELGKVLRKAVISSQGLAALTNRLVRDLALPQAVI